MSVETIRSKLKTLETLSVSGTVVDLSNIIEELVTEVENSGVSIPATAYASNSEAVAALGVGVLYKSTTSMGPQGDSSPIILITI